jgi:hypothetical protein
MWAIMWRKKQSREIIFEIFEPEVDGGAIR